VGLGVGIPFLLGIGLLGFLFIRRRRKAAEAPAYGPVGVDDHENQEMAGPRGGMPPELKGDALPHELKGDGLPHELPAETELRPREV
jgi:hypothetical protein